MTLVESYVLRVTFVAFLTALGALCAVIWLTQAMREFDLLASKGQTASVFFSVTGLALPAIVMVVAPVALFIAVAYALNRLNEDSELVVMSASGVAPSQLVRPFALLFGAVALLVALLSMDLAPRAYREMRDLYARIRADYLTRIIRPGEFAALDRNFTFHFRSRGADGTLHGILIQDRRDPAKVATYLADVGVAVETNGQNYLVLKNGSFRRQVPGSAPETVLFDRYALDLDQFGPEVQGMPLRPRERTMGDLFGRDPMDPYVQGSAGRFRAELHERFLNPLYALVLGMVAFAALGEPRTTRIGRGRVLFVTILVALAVRLAGFAASALLARHEAAVVLVYAIPSVALLGATACIFRREAFWPKRRMAAAPASLESALG